MAQYTYTELQALTSVAKVATWDETKILVYQETAEAILSGLGMDTSMSGYSTAFKKATLFLFDLIAENPIGLKSKRVGKVSMTFDDLPLIVKKLVEPFVTGADGTLTPAKMERMDIGRR